jgi:hypothetical protein
MEKKKRWLLPIAWCEWDQGAKAIFWDVCSQHHLSSTVESEINGIRGIWGISGMWGISGISGSGASRPSEGENGRLKIDIAENIRSLLHFRSRG